MNVYFEPGDELSIIMNPMLKDIPLPMHRHPDFPKKDVAKKITETLAYEDV